MSALPSSSAKARGEGEVLVAVEVGLRVNAVCARSDTGAIATSASWLKVRALAAGVILVEAMLALVDAGLANTSNCKASRRLGSASSTDSDSAVSAGAVSVVPSVTGSASAVTSGSVGAGGGVDASRGVTSSCGLVSGVSLAMICSFT